MQERDSLFQICQRFLALLARLQVCIEFSLLLRRKLFV
jgi:hypothetical protein